MGVNYNLFQGHFHLKHSNKNFFLIIAKVQNYSWNLGIEGHQVIFFCSNAFLVASYY